MIVFDNIERFSRCHYIELVKLGVAVYCPRYGIVCGPSGNTQIRAFCP